MPLGLAQAVGQQGTRLHRMVAASIHVMLPAALLVLLLQSISSASSSLLGWAEC
jgi:hypothetical protein